jgi:hypothetical protein
LAWSKPKRRPTLATRTLTMCSIQCQHGYHAERRVSSTLPRALPSPHHVLERPSCSVASPLILTRSCLPSSLSPSRCTAPPPWSRGAPRRHRCSPNSELPCIPLRAPLPLQRRAPPRAHARLSRLSLECPHHLTVWP